MRISVKYNNGSEVPEVKRQDTPVFLTSQQLNLRKLMNSISPDESASGSYSFSINNPEGLQNSRFNFTVAAGSRSIIPGGSFIPG
jgi:hypothetical protein